MPSHDTPLPPGRHALALHGGAGTIARSSAEAEAPYHAALRAALAAGDAVLSSGGTALQAVVAAVVALEDCPLFNAGHGAVFTADETHELDAGVMDGRTLAAGALAGVTTLRNPILGALEVLRDGHCVLMGGAAAERWCAARGVASVEPGYFSTAQRRAQLHAARARDRDRAVLDHTGASTKMGTVGAVALDRHGHIAAATSTGGMTNKRPGRIGDTPLVGAGVYAHDAGCAVSTTGTGEHFIRGCVAHDVHARMVYAGLPLADAAHRAITESLAPLGGSGGLVAIDRQGRIAMPYNSDGMYRAWLREGESARSAVFDDAI
ncbi:MAG: isoaspartyl peptidase/L-asparaginase [Rubrivivax sp.]|nr:isoaspartyl peptidase/L-asparaginase [Rubrivivax sp.]